MRCYCCDKELSEAEIQYIPNTLKFEMCGFCYEIAMDTAYCDGFVRPDDAEGVATILINDSDSYEDQYHLPFNDDKHYQKEEYVE